MKLSKMASFLALLLFAVFAAPAAALASEPASATWNNVWAPPSPDQQQVDQNRAIADRIARDGGYGPSVTTIQNTTTIGTQDNQTNVYGDQISSGATNSVNSNSTSNYVGAGATNVVIRTRATQTTDGDIAQGATAQTSSSDDGGTSTVTAATSAHP